MPGALSHLEPVAQQELLGDLNYLNLREIRSFCDRHALPYRIVVETPGGGTTTTKDTDRKPIVLRRIRHFLATGERLGPTCLPARIVRDHAPPSELRPTDRLYYRWYNKTYRSVIGLLEDLTHGRFENGALARVLIMEYWTAGKAPTFAEFADAWVAAKDASRQLVSSEYAFLTDLQRGETGPDWKAIRTAKAERALALLDELCG